MASRQLQVKIRTFGIYTKWDADSKALPKLVEVTEAVPAEVDIEFGFVARIRGAKNKRLFYCIDHPGIRDSEGQVRPPFDGFVYVKTNDWDFYLGDTIWEPIEDKVGHWHMWVEIDGIREVEKTFEVY